jgi:hypothetical protein
VSKEYFRLKSVQGVTRLLKRKFFLATLRELVLSIRCAKFTIRMIGSLLLSLGLISSNALHAQELPNHYIVLFDGSGSMDSDYRYTFWQGKTGNSASMAYRMSQLVNSALIRGVEEHGIPAHKKQDFVSFALFNLEFYTPSYANDKMFLSNEELILSKGLPHWGDYKSFDNSARKSRAAIATLSESFSGHSPIVAATTGVLPFVAQQAKRYQLIKTGTKVGRIFIVRITDGTYNARANGADESSVIVRTIDYLEEQRLLKGDKSAPVHSQPANYDDYMQLARKVNGAFDIGINRVECAFIVSIGNIGGLECDEGAYRLVSKKRQGFLISFMEVKPRGGALHGLATVASKTLELNREVKDGKVDFVETNRIVAAGAADQFGRTVLSNVSWRVNKENTFKKCKSNPNDNIIRCQDGDEIRISKDASNKLPELATYRFLYERIFNDDVPLYPFTYALPPYSIDVSLKEKPPTMLDNQFYQLPRNPDDFSLAFLAPARVIRTNVDNPPHIPITDELLLSQAQGNERLTAAGLTRRSNRIKEAFMAQEVYFNDLAKVFWGLFFICIVITILYWPKRKLYVEQRDFTGAGICLDFNHREHENIALIGQIKVKNIAKTRYHKPFNLAMTLGNSQVRLDDKADIKGFELADRIGAPFSLANPGEIEHKDPMAVTGKEYSIYLDPSDIVDFPLSGEEGEHKVTLQSSVTVKAGQAGSNEQPITVDLLLKPENSNLKIIRPVTIELDDNDFPMLIANYKNGIDDDALGHYLLQNNTRHQFSLSAKGTFSIEVRDKHGNRKDGVIRLRDEQAELVGTSVAFNIKSRSELELVLLMNFTALSNPIDYEDYDVVIRIKDHKSEEWRTYEHWTLRLQRDAARTEVSMQVKASEQKKSVLLNAARQVGTAPFILGSNARPIKVRMDSGAGKHSTKLFSVALVNACHDGIGFAKWHARIAVTACQGFELGDALSGLYLVDSKGKKLNSGVLHDGRSDSERLINLYCEIQHNEIIPQRRTMKCSLKVSVDWHIFEDGNSNESNYQKLHNEMVLECFMVHEPPRRAIAIDSGTSGYAIAFSRGPGAVDLLQLQQQAQKLRPGKFHIDNADPNSPFLSSECNVNLNAAQLKTLRPDEANFITLPRDPKAIATQPEKVFVGVKALFSAGYNSLPLSPSDFPYAAADGAIEKYMEPQLNDVIAGIYEGLLLNYITPMLAAERLGFSHLYLTHPNTYTPNHVAHLRDIVESVFKGHRHGKDDVIYPENIRFYSESDAVAFYYMLNVWQSYGKDWSKVPKCEYILVFDIGAGTLDLTYLEVDWLPNENEGKTPARVKILRRGGVSKAGNLLDECIARDLHEYLSSKLTKKDYINPIVVQASEKMSKETRLEMDVLRQRIQKLKIEVSQGQPKLRMPLSSQQYDLHSIVRTNVDETKEMYSEFADLEGTLDAEVFWTPSIDTIKSGKHVKAFLRQVTKVEIDRFFGNELPLLNTVILSGRTSLWPGFKDALKESLGDALHWENFKGNAKDLKKAVALGVLESEFRWPDLKFIQPDIIGKFGIRYEYSGPGDWRFFEFEKSGVEQTHTLRDASMLEVGLQSNNGFNRCVTMIPCDFYDPSDKKLLITLNFDAEGNLQACIKNSKGDEQMFNEIVNISVLNYSAQPWPIGSSKLIYKPVDNVLND